MSEPERIKRAEIVAFAEGFATNSEMAACTPPCTLDEALFLIAEMAAALEEALQGWRAEMDDEYGDTAKLRKPTSLARIDELRANFLGGSHASH